MEITFALGRLPVSWHLVSGCCLLGDMSHSTICSIPNHKGDSLLPVERPVRLIFWNCRYDDQMTWPV